MVGYPTDFHTFKNKTQKPRSSRDRDSYPNHWVYATGSNPARTRLYRIGITSNYEEILTDFEVFGLSNETWQEFEKEKEYYALLVKRKIH
jgi:hypothetical protein